MNFGTVAAKVGVGDFWQGGSKKPAIVFLLTHTFDRERGTFQALVEEIVRAGLNYRQKQGNPITAAEIDQVNGHILELGFKFPELWDKDFRSSLRQADYRGLHTWIGSASKSIVETGCKGFRCHLSSPFLRPN